MALSVKQRFLNIPNYITLGRIALVPLLFVIMLFLDDEAPSFQKTNQVLCLAATAIFVVAMVSDVIDGWYARRSKIISTFGQFFDPLADKVLFLVAMIFMIPQGRILAWIVVVFLVREVVVTALRGVAIDEGIVIAASRWGKYKSALISAATTGLLIHYPFLGVEWRLISWLFVFPALIFSMVSGVHYTVSFIKELQQKQKRS